MVAFVNAKVLHLLRETFFTHHLFFKIKINNLRLMTIL